MTQHFEPKIREPIFNVPLVVIATVVVLVLVHALRMFALTDEQDLQFLLTFAFIPARYGSELAASGAFPGGLRRRSVDLFYLRVSARRSHASRT